MDDKRCAMLVGTWEVVVADGESMHTVRLNELKREEGIIEAIRQHCPQGTVVLVTHTDVTINYAAVIKAVAPDTTVVLVPPAQAIENLVRRRGSYPVDCTQFTFSPDKAHTLVYVEERMSHVFLWLCTVDDDGVLGSPVRLLASDNNRGIEHYSEVINDTLHLIKCVAHSVYDHTPRVLVATCFMSSIGSMLMAAMKREFAKGNGTVAIISEPMAPLAGGLLIARAL